MKSYIVQSYLNCERCTLCKTRRGIVFGRGSIPADILFITDVPSKGDELLREPLTGPVGALLSRAIKKALELNNSRQEPSYFITNLVACRPAENKHAETREPRDNEVISCSQRLEKTYKDIKPRRIVFLGKLAAQNAIKQFPSGIALPHPAFILRQGGVEAPSFRSFARDLAVVFNSI